MSATDMLRARAAAGSIASGRPSSRAQRSAMRARSMVTSGRTAVARATNRSTAGDETARVSSIGKGRRRCVTSPAIISGARDVARTVTSAVAAMRSATARARRRRRSARSCRARAATGVR